MLDGGRVLVGRGEDTGDGPDRPPAVTVARFECDGCGACCRTFPIFASAADARREPRIVAEGRALAEHLATDHWHYQLYPLPFHVTCCFLDGDARCTIYPTRPDVCRAFPAGGEQCQTARARLGLPPLPEVRS